METYPTPSKKAEELINMFFKAKHQPYSYKDAQSCALIAVNELIKSVSDVNSWYWEEVKEEIEKL